MEATEAISPSEKVTLNDALDHGDLRRLRERTTVN